MARTFFERIESCKAAVVCAVAAVFLAILAMSAVWFHRQAHRPSVALATPAFALETLQTIHPRSLYYSAAARPWLSARESEFLQPDDRSADSAQSREFRQATQNPKLFRQLDRALRFDTLLLVGDPSQYRPLLEHLLETKDWTLSYVDHTSLIFKREAEHAWQPEELELVRQRFSAPHEEAVFLAQVATKLIALRRVVAAEKLLAQAEKLDARIPDIWHARAIACMNRGDFVEARVQVDRALALEPGSLAALGTKAQILYSTKQIGEALTLSAQLIAARPGDPALLFYHAKIAHDAHAFREEIAALEKLVAVAEREGQPASGYRIYLAQAYASDGQAEPSIAQFKRALADSDLSGEQRRFAEETLAQIKRRSGL
jgi:tetratricopeptide (TPR) repeat protein